MTPEPVLCFDGDGAGLRAAYRAADLALPLIGPGQVGVFRAASHGKDPDDLVKHDGRAPFDRVMAQAKPLAEMIWTRNRSPAVSRRPKSARKLEARLRADHQCDRGRDCAPPLPAGDARKAECLLSAAAARWWKLALGRWGRAQRRQLPAGVRRVQRGSQANSRVGGISDSLARSGMVRGHQDVPTLREAVLALTIVNHPQILIDEYDHIADLEFENRDIQKLRSRCCPRPPWRGR